MNLENVNKSVTAVLNSEAAIARTLAPYREASKALNKIDDQHEDAWQRWNQHIIEIGNAMIESRKHYGPEWMKHYDSLGYAVSYRVACMYIICATYPDAGDGTASLEEWAQAAEKCNQSATMIDETHAVATGAKALSVARPKVTVQPVGDNYDCLDYATE